MIRHERECLGTNVIVYTYCAVAGPLYKCTNECVVSFLRSGSN